MRALVATVIAVSSLAASQQQPRGVLKTLTVRPGPIVGNFKFAVDGTNPCTAVHMEFGDGSSYTYPIKALPDAETIWHHYTRDGKYTIRASGANNCDGDATVSVTVTLPAGPPPPPTPVTPPPTGGNERPPDARPAAPIRFASMDQNNDRSISKAEWRGSKRSFEFHDWNSDGRLSGDELRFGALPPASALRATSAGRGRQRQTLDWSEALFRSLDSNRDNRVSLGEWPFDTEDFVRVDRNRDGFLTLSEYLPSDIDDDRGDRFDDLDLNGDGRVDRNEWHGSAETFRWLDANNDGVITKLEGTTEAQHGAASPAGPVAGNEIIVSSRSAWTDTGIDIRSGDVITILATGTIQFSPNPRDQAGPDGASGRAATSSAPLPRTEIGALIGRIGRTPFFVGAKADNLRPPREGRLYLGVNDDILRDNAGEFRVTIRISRGR